MKIPPQRCSSILAEEVADLHQEVPTFSCSAKGGGQRTLNPDSPSGSSLLVVTRSTSAPRGPAEQNSTIASTPAGGPSNTASTAPSRRLHTHPATPRRAASRRVLSRKSTPWT